MQEQTAISFHPFQRDKFGREILERKATFYLRDNEIVLRGSLKKNVKYEIRVKGKTEIKEEVQYIAMEPDDIPIGWYHRKEYDYFYHPNNQNLATILQFKLKYNDWVKFAQSFCIYAVNKLYEAKEIDEAFKQIVGLTLTDIDKIKALPDLVEKQVPDMAHQKIASRYAYYLPQSGQLLEQGLGKTKIAIEAYIGKKKRDLVDRCLVIGPLSVINKNGWVKQIKEYAPDYSYEFVRGDKDNKISILDGEEGFYDFYLANYEGLLSIKNEVLSWIDDRTMVILDESSKIKNYQALRTKLCLEIGKLAKHKMILTGTPVTQNAYDVFSQYYFLDCGDSFGQSYDSFLKKYFVTTGYKKIAKHGALEAINEIIMRKSCRFTKEQALPDLPEKTYQIREVQMSPLQRKYYDAILAQSILKLSEMEHITAQNILVEILRLQQITSGFLSAKDSNDVQLAPKAIESSNAKLSELEDLLEEIGDKPVVIWSRFRYDVMQISRLLKEMDISYVQYVGGMSELIRQQAEGDFLSGKAQVFVSIPSAGGYGMNLQRASYAIYYSNDYSLQNRLQSEDRIHRMGQKSNCTIIDIVCDRSIDLTVLSVLQSKKQIADVVTGDWKQFLLDNL